MDNRVVGLIPAKDSQKALVHAINQGIANTLRKHRFASKQMHSVHDSLVVCEDGGANEVAFGVKKQLLDVLESCLGLIGIARADFGED